MLIFVKVIYDLSEKIDTVNQQERLINRNMKKQVCMVLILNNSRLKSNLRKIKVKS